MKLLFSLIAFVSCKFWVLCWLTSFNSKSSNNWRGTGWESEGTSYSAERAFQSYVRECRSRKGGFNNLEDIPSFLIGWPNLFVSFQAAASPILQKSHSMQVGNFEVSIRLICLYLIFLLRIFFVSLSASHNVTLWDVHAQREDSRGVKTCGRHLNVFYAQPVKHMHANLLWI